MANAMRKWIKLATREELDVLAELSKVSVGTIRQVAGAYRTKGVPRATPEVARSIDLATHRLAREGLPPIKREELCPACSRCEYTLCRRKEK